MLSSHLVDGRNYYSFWIFFSFLLHYTQKIPYCIHSYLSVDPSMEHGKCLIMNEWGFLFAWQRKMKEGRAKEKKGGKEVGRKDEDSLQKIPVSYVVSANKAFSNGQVQEHNFMTIWICLLGKKLVLESNCMHAQLVSHVWLFTTQWDCSPPGFSVQGIFHARILEWVVISSSRVSSWPRGWNLISYISCTCSQILYRWATSK